jgi:putative Mg2+ transporter-C (MgtC) family protein
MSIGAVLGRIILSGVVGALIGLSTQKITKARLFSMVCMGAALITYISSQYFIHLSMTWYADPIRLPAQVIVALGFIGSGLIWVSSEKKVEGLGTAAALWVTAIIGIAIGGGLSSVSAGVIIFLIIFYLAQKLLTKFSRKY